MDGIITDTVELAEQVQEKLGRELVMTCYVHGNIFMIKSDENLNY
mgnify:CR=1 FL=1